jgi:iron complex transport system substrate-binding protein
MTQSVLDTESMSSPEIDRAIGGELHSGSSIYVLDHEALAAAKPDLILTQELCEVCAVSYAEVTSAARMMDLGARILSLEPTSIEDIFSNIRTVARVCGVEEAGTRTVDELRARLERVRAQVAGREPVATACLEWTDPLYDAGHWVPEQVEWAGGIERLGRKNEASRNVLWEAVLEAEPEVLLIMPCGFGVQRSLQEASRLPTMPGWSSIPAVRGGRVWVVNGAAYFDRPGPRTVRGVEILAHVLHDVGEIGEDEARRL